MSEKITEYKLDKTVKYFFLIVFVFGNWSVIGHLLQYEYIRFKDVMFFVLIWGSALLAVYRVVVTNDDEVIIYRLVQKKCFKVKDIKSIKEIGLGFQISSDTQKAYIPDVLSEKRSLINNLISINNSIEYHTGS